MYSPTSSSPRLLDADPEILTNFDKLQKEQYGIGHTFDGPVKQVDESARE